MAHSSYLPKGEIAYTLIDSPLGPLGLAAKDDKLAAIQLNADPVRFPFQVERTLGASGTKTSRPFAEITRQLDEYFAGRRLVFRLPLDFSHGTPFQRQVWKALLDIPYGRRVSYKQVAESIGRPSAVRAVGSANGANPIPIVAPCHRVITSDGSLGGYSGGPDIKRTLLGLEAKTLAQAAHRGVHGADGHGRYGLWS